MLCDLPIFKSCQLSLKYLVALLLSIFYFDGLYLNASSEGQMINDILSERCIYCHKELPEQPVRSSVDERIYLFCHSVCKEAWQATRQYNENHQNEIGKNFTWKLTGFDHIGMDTHIKPENDFYHFAGGNWIRENPIPEGYSRWGSFDMLNKRVNDNILALLNQISAPESQEEKITKALFDSAMNLSKRNQTEFFSPVSWFVDLIDRMDDGKDVMQVSGKLQTFGVNSLFSWSVGPNPLENQTNILHLYEGGLNLPDFEMYLADKDSDENGNQIKREMYVTYISQLIKRLGFTESVSTNMAYKILAFETELAKVHLSKEDLRDPDITVNVFSRARLSQAFPNFDWDIFFTEMGINPQFVNVDNPRFFVRLGELLKTSEIHTISSYMMFSLINQIAPFSEEASVQLHFDFYHKKLQGVDQPLPLDERSAREVSAILGDAVGKLYINKHFPPKRKEKALDMVNLIKEALVEQIQELSWMQAPTKLKAIEKVKKMEVLVGYPDEGYWKNYRSLTTVDANIAYATNVLLISHFNAKEELKKVETEVDKKDWPWPPQVVNACNVPSQNKIVFPAGILDFPFFTDDDAVTWGAFGMVIAHEMIHSFDDSGRKFDCEGNKCDWWLPEDSTRFQEHADVIVEQFNQYTLSFSEGNSLSVNGKMTLGENIADLGGLIIAYRAMQNYQKNNPLTEINGWKPEQRFFLGFSQVWRMKCKEERAKLLLSIDPHSPPLWRVNGPLSQMPEFQQAFNLPDDCPMVVPEEQRSKMWSNGRVKS